MGQGHQERAQRQQQPPHANHPRSVNSAAEVADEDDEDHVADLERAQRNGENVRRHHGGSYDMITGPP